MFKSMRTDITSSVRKMQTIRITYFDKKCMYLSKLLHNQWFTSICTDVVILMHTDVNGTDMIILHKKLIKKKHNKFMIRVTSLKEVVIFILLYNNMMII